ncbi:MAG: DUF3987 domain-containing protein [Deltaproteobacteria bacterium]|nr:DUF3987 domain-containing protein [Deltaproteobacteria bacterium]
MLIESPPPLSEAGTKPSSTYTVRDTAVSLGLSLTPGTEPHLDGCPLCGARGHGSAKVHWSAKHHRLRWFCHRCEKGGGSKELVAAANYGKEWAELDPEEMDAVFRVALLPRSGPPAALSVSAPPVTAPETIADLFKRSNPATSSKVVAAWLRLRGLDPERIGREDLLRALPTTGTLPTWATSWVAHHRALIPLYDTEGVLSGVRARDVRATPPKGRKDLAPRGAKVGGLVMANPTALSLLRGEALDADPLVVVVVEGGPDFLTWASLAPDLPVFGVFSGAWTSRLADKVPDGATVVLRNHLDKAGEKFATAIRQTLEGRCALLRLRGPVEQDENDKLVAGTFSTDPRANTGVLHEGGWGLPTSYRAVPEVPSFPTHLLPDPLRRYVYEVATAKQTPTDLVGLLVLAVLSTAVLGKVKVRGWRSSREGTEWLALYVVVAMNASSAKSPVFREVTAPLREGEDAAMDKAAQLNRERGGKRASLERRIKRLEKQADKTDDDAERSGLEAQINTLHAELETLTTRVSHRLLVDDITPEALPLRLRENMERLAVFSDEGGIFRTVGGRFNHSIPNIDVVKKGWDGGSHTVDRVGRADPIRLRAPVLTFGLAIQPSVVEEVTAQPEFRSTGLIARFLWSMPKSLVGHRDMDPPAMTREAGEAYDALIQKLLALEVPSDPKGRIIPKVMNLSDEAYELFKAFRTRQEPRLAEGADLDLLSDWAGKLPSQVLRIAALLTIVDRANTPDEEPLAGEVSASSMRAAIELGEGYLLTHAGASIFKPDSYETVASVLVGWLKSRPRMTQLSETEARKVVERALGRSGASFLGAGLELLSEHRYIRRVEMEKRRGRPRNVWEVNPDWNRKE